jgi:asparagine synthase (glutamine-hydrolysing)
LPPAHILTLEAGRIKIERYWSLSYRTINKISETEYCRRIQDELAEATRIRLMSDVPLGAFLSGGIDSSAVVAMMSRFSAKPVKTFSIGFREHSFNELKYARKIAKIFGAEHREYTVTPNALDVLPKLIRHFDEPFADSSAIPTYYLSQMTRQEVAVALNGDGGDESFAGYERYAAAKISGRYSRLPYSLRRVVASSVRNLPESTRKKDFIKSLKRFTGASLLSAEKRYFSWMFLFSPQAKNHLYSGDFKVSLGKMDCGDYLGQAYSQSAEKEPLSSLLAVDVLTYLPEDLLVKVDIAAMANSLEARSPFLDHKLMEFAASIPANLKLKGISTKPLLKKALAGILPRDILARKKYGFGVPVGSWFRHQLKDYAYEILLSPRCLKRGYFRKESIKSLLDEHTSAKFDHGQRIWGLLNLELWHQIFREK